MTYLIPLRNTKKYVRNLLLDFCWVPIVTNQLGLGTILAKTTLLEAHHVSHGPESMDTEYLDLV